MQVITTICDLRRHLREVRKSASRIGLVPTMGNLHAGHLKLVTSAVEQCDHVVSTVFVNPLQFGAEEDLEAYPRTLQQDTWILQEHGCDCLFAPGVEEMYGKTTGQATVIHVPGLSENYCGATRPGHFDGVATIVAKLINIASPDKAFFGLKDYQQFLVIRKLVTDLSMKSVIVGVETVREDDGLAMSSRNNYLSAEERTIAGLLHRCLGDTQAAIENGEGNFPLLARRAMGKLETAGFKPDYFAVCNAETLEPASNEDSSLAVLGAAHLGRTRLIDNVRFRRAV